MLCTMVPPPLMQLSVNVVCSCSAVVNSCYTLFTYWLYITAHPLNVWVQRVRLWRAGKRELQIVNVLNHILVYLTIHPCLINLYWQKYIQAQQYIKQARKIVHRSPGHEPWSSVKVTMIRCRANKRQKTKQQKIMAYTKIMYIHATAMTKQWQLKVRLVCGPPGWFVASIPDGIAREDGNLTEVFFEWLRWFGFDGGKYLWNCFIGAWSDQTTWTNLNAGEVTVISILGNV